MDTNSLRTALELIIARSNVCANDAVVGLFALQRQPPLTRDRYKQIVSLALLDASANWTADERSLLLIAWAETIDVTQKKSHLVQLTESDWALAVTLGNGNGSLGIRTALRHLREKLDHELC